MGAWARDTMVARGTLCHLRKVRSWSRFVGARTRGDIVTVGWHKAGKCVMTEKRSRPYRDVGTPPEPAVTPLRSLGHAVPMVPESVTTFVGRDRELREIRALLDRDHVRLVTLIGPGGVGKTRLASRVGAEMAAGDARRVWFVSLVAVHDPALVLPVIARTVGLRESGDRSVSEMFAEFLGSQEVVLILDNFERVLDAGPAVTELLAACPSLKVLVTSRFVLSVSGEHVYSVPPLSLPAEVHGRSADRVADVEAVRLFVDRAASSSSSFALTDANAATVADICRRLDGLPLALELAAARMASLSPAALLSLLEHRLTLLTHGVRDAPPRHRSMRDAIAWSYDLLTEEDQRAFRHLAVFAGGFTLSAAEAVLGETGATYDTIDSLVARSMLVPVEAVGDDPRFVMLETLREYGLERLEESSEEEHAARKRHAAFYASRAARFWTPEVPAEFDVLLKACGQDHGNLRTAFAWAREHEPEVAMCLASGLDWYFTVFGHVAEGRVWIAWCETASENRIDALRGRILLASALLALQHNELDRAEELIRRAIIVTRECHEPYLLAVATLQLGDVVFCQGRFDEAQALSAEARHMAMEIVDPLLVTLVIVQEGRIASSIGNLMLAEARLSEALRRYQDMGMTFGVTIASHFLARVVAAQGDGARAATLFGEAIAVWRHYGDWVNVARAMEGLAGIPNASLTSQAVHLLGAASAIRENLHHAVDHEDRAEYDKTLSRLVDSMPSKAFETAWRNGTALPWDAAADAAVQFVDSIVHDEQGEPETPFGLSPRELDVLRLLVEGKTDGEIARALFISQRTAATHIRHIYDKLGVSSRAAAAAFAVRQGLA